MPLTVESKPDQGTIELTIRGALELQDYVGALPSMSALVAQCGQIGVLEIVESFSGLVGDFPEENDEATMALLSRISRVALVSDIGWFCPILSNAPHAAGMTLRSFPLSELEAARKWVAEEAE
ncbi:STAS/SEC14 domain-containing protein [Pacificoceanicola onchidii]|uniref:STAS/SEC14 domain-containing protein n=1 Tax=Pacificoceanicola onchidii TaxID=2562685 RepID=UPI0010A530C6|nr:STAS/SEC14 domain-containing protein [Pacificoceanicola onchidii]